MKILVFAPNWLGDVIFITPIFAALKKQYPNAVIGCCLPERCKDVLLNNPNVDEIIAFNEKKEDKGMLARLYFIFKLRSYKYDRVVLLHRSMTRAFLCSMAGIRERWGYAYKKRAWILTQSLPVIDKDSLHKQDYYLDLARGLGIAADDSNCRVFVSPQERLWADNLLAEYKRAGQKIVILNLLTNWAPKNWPISHFNKFITMLREKNPGVVFLLTSASAKEEFKPLSQGKEQYVIDLSGKTSVRQLAALSSRADLIVSGDSGPLHLAAAVGAKYLGIYGPTDPRLTGVRADVSGKILSNSNGCKVPCYEDPCTMGLKCTSGVLPETAVEEAMKLL